MQNEYKIMSVDDLTPYINNSRTHSKAQVAQVVSSIKEFGFTNPILIDEAGGIIAGHGRLMAAKQLELSEVPTITLHGLTEAQKKAYIIADNQLALNSGWDFDMLRVEIEDLQELEFDIDLLGFDDGFLGDLFGEEKEDYQKEITDETEYNLIVSFDNETDQERLYLKLSTEGHEVRIME